MDVNSDLESKNAIPTDNSDDEGKGGSDDEEKGGSEGEGNGGNEGEGNGSEGEGNGGGEEEGEEDGDKDGAQDGDGEDEVQSWNGKGKGKGKAKEASYWEKAKHASKRRKKTRKGGYDATNRSILPLKVSGFMQIKG